MGIADVIAKLQEPHLGGTLSDADFEEAKRPVLSALFIAIVTAAMNHHDSSPDPLGHTCRPGRTSHC